MLITIYHNEFHKELEIKEDDSMGHLLEKFLQCCNRFIVPVIILFTPNTGSLFTNFALG